MDIVSYAGTPAVLGESDTTLLKKVPDIPKFSGTEHEKGYCKIRAMAPFNFRC